MAYEDTEYVAGYDDKRLSQDTSVTRSDFERKENNEQLPSLTKKRVLRRYLGVFCTELAYLLASIFADLLQ